MEAAVQNPLQYKLMLELSGWHFANDVHLQERGQTFE